jgi:hypothetical protein
MAKGKPFGRQFVPDHEWQLSARSGPSLKAHSSGNIRVS